MVNVPPVTSSGCRCRSRARRATSPILDDERAEPQRVRVVHDGHDEVVVVEVDGDAEVHRVVRRDLVAGDGRVAERELVERVDHRARDEREVREPGGAADAVDASVVALDHHVRVRGGGLGLDEPARGRAPERG